MAVNLYVEALEGADMGDLLSLVRPQKAEECVYVFDSSARAVRKATGERLPWPIVWLLGRHSRKHVFLTRRMPTLVDLYSGVSQLRAQLHRRARRALRHRFRSRSDSRPALPRRNKIFALLGGDEHPVHRPGRPSGRR